MKLCRTRAGSRATLGTGQGLVFRTAEPRPAVFGTSRPKRILNGGRVFQGSLLLQRQTSQKQRKTTQSLCADIVATIGPFYYVEYLESLASLRGDDPHSKSTRWLNGRRHQQPAPGFRYFVFVEDKSSKPLPILDRLLSIYR